MQVITGGLIDLEINDIITETNENVFKDYAMYLHTTEEDVWVQFLKTVEIYSSYNENLTDFIYVTFDLPLGDYAKDILKYSDNLEATLEYTKDDELISNRYKLIITNVVDNIRNSDLNNETKETLNKLGFINLEAQLVLREMEALRTILIDGSYRNTTVEDVMYTILKLDSEKATVEGETIDLAIDIYEPDNTKNYEHILFPTGTKLLDVPTYLQEGDYGVYNASIGVFLTNIKDKITLFVYPLFNYERYDKEEKKLNIYYSQTDTLNQIENTYKEEGDVIKILAGTTTESKDTGENDLIDSGVGIVSDDPRAPLYKETVVTDDEAVTDQSNRLTGDKMKKRRDNVDKYTYIGNESNGFKYRSAMIHKFMSYYTIKWNFSDTSLLYPGMPVKYIYEDNDEGMIELTGTLLCSYTRWVKNSNVETTLLFIAVIKPSAYLEL